MPDLPSCLLCSQGMAWYRDWGVPREMEGWGWAGWGRAEGIFAQLCVSLRELPLHHRDILLRSPARGSRSFWFYFIGLAAASEPEIKHVLLICERVNY